MKGSCPLKTAPEWVASQNSLGEDNTWELWMVSKEGVVPEPVAGAFYFFAKEDPKTAAQLLTKHIPAVTRAGFDLGTNILDMLNVSQDAIFQEPVFKAWIKTQPFFDKIFEGEKVKRTPEQEVEVEKRVQTLTELANEVVDIDMDKIINPVDLQNEMRANEIIYKLGKRYSDAEFEGRFSIVTSAEAKLIMEKGTIPYRGEAVFLDKKVMYYVKDKINLNTEFHKMALPVLLLMKRTQGKTFDNMYRKLLTLPEGQALVDKVAKLYPNLNQSYEGFQARVMIAALEADATNRHLNKAKQIINDASNKDFNNFTKEFMGTMRKAIKQAMGSKIEANKINTDTTLNEVAEILSPTVKIEAENITAEQFKEYDSDLKKAAKEITDAIAKDPNKRKIDERLDDFLQDFLRKAGHQQRTIHRKKGFADMRKELADPEHGGYLKQMLDQLRYFRTDVTPEQLEANEKVSETMKAQSLVNALFTLEKTLLKINEYLDGVTPEQSVQKLAQVDNYGKVLKDWESFIKNAEKELHKAGVARNTFIYGFVSRLNGLIDDGSTRVAEIKETGSIKTTTDLLKSFTEKIGKGIDAEIERLKGIAGDEATRQKRIKKLLEEKEKYNFTEDKVRALYKGELGDSNWWSNMFISFSDDPDPIVATFSLYLKKHMAQITSRAYYKAAGFAGKTNALMEKVGINQSNPRSWMDQGFLMIDQKHAYKDGQLVSQDVVSFMQATKGWRFDKAKLEKTLEEAKATRDKTKIKNVYKAIEAMEKVFNREYSAEFYEARAKLREENLDAYEALEAVNAEIDRFKIENTDDYDFFQNYDELTELLKKKAQLGSIYDENGILKSEKDQAIARAITAHKKATSKFYESKERRGAFQRAIDAWILSCQNNPNYAGITFFDEDGNMTAEFADIFDEWLSQNTVVRHTQAYYDLTNSLYERIAELSKDLPVEYNISDAYAQRSAIMIGYKDNNGQFDPDLITDAKKREEIIAKLKAIDEQIDKVMFKQRYQPLTRELTPKESAAMASLKLVFAELSRIKYKDPSQYYLDTLNNYLVTVNSNTVDADTVDSIVGDNKKIEALLQKNSEFRVWFNKNHIKSNYVNNKGETKYSYKRLDAWSVAKPMETEGGPVYTQSTTITVNGKKKTIPGIPTSKYFYYKIKDSYVNEKGEKVPIRTVPFGLTEEEITERYVGKVIDNKGNYLPLTKEQALAQGVSTTYEVVDPNTGEKTGETRSYINEDYYNMIKDPNKKKLLDEIYKYHLDNQVGTERSKKLYLDLPRVPVSSMLEGIQRGTIQKKWVDRLKGIGAGMAATFKGKDSEEANRLSKQAGDEAEGFADSEMEEEREKFTMLKDGIIDPFMDKIPVKGLENIPIDQISYDVVGVLNFYMLQLETEKVLREINPVAKAMLETLENTDKGLAQLKAIREKSAGLVDTLRAFAGGKKNEQSRTAAIRALYSREIQGQVNSERHLDWLNKVTAGITGAASINYFALNIPSAVKNYWGILWQMNVEAIAGEYFDFNSLAKAKYRSKTAMSEWTTRIWGANYNTVDTQMIIHFDPMQGKAAEVITKDFSRTFARDLASLSWTYSPRKFMEMEGAMQLFYSIMYHTKVPRTVDGRQTTISYADAFQLDKEGKLVLKDGIDPEWGITYDEKGNPTLGKEFVRIQNVVHTKFKDLNGTFAKFEQPQAQQYFAYRLFAFMRRYFTSMFMHRFGKRRANFAVEEIRTGYYVEAVTSIAKTLISLGKELPFMSASEKRAIMRMTMDIAQIIIVSMMASLLFGWDPDDEDRFEKLRAKSGALGDDDFRLDGWLSNHALTLLLKTQAENQSFIPLPGLGLNNYMDLTNSTSIAFGPTITSWAKIITDLSMHALPGENEDLFYKKDTGPYDWQKEGSAKIWNHLATMLGFSGSQVDPVKGLQSFEAFSKM